MPDEAEVLAVLGVADTVAAISQDIQYVENSSSNSSDGTPRRSRFMT